MDASDLAAAIGERVRANRKARSWTLDQLAANAGVSRRLLVSVEQGAVNPSLSTLLRLSEALGIALPVLVEPPKNELSTVTRAGDAAVLWRGDAGGEASMVAAATLPDAFELWWWTLEPSDSRETRPHTAGTRELLLVHVGTLTLVLDGDCIELGPGDAVSFRGDVPHAYRNDGEATVSFSGAVFEPAIAP